MDEYTHGVVGAKSKNLAGLHGKVSVSCGYDLMIESSCSLDTDSNCFVQLPPHIRLPSSVTLPFGCFEQALESKENHAISDKIRSLVSTLNGKKTSPSDPSASTNSAELLAECRQLAMQVAIPSSIRSELQAAMQLAGIPLPANEERWSLALNALRGVWASKYNDRAYYSLKKVGLVNLSLHHLLPLFTWTQVGLNFDDVRMAVLVQQIVPARYAFVIHTRNPSNNDESEVFCEMVRGLGESLVSGMVPGSAVAFKAKKEGKGLDEPELLCYASKGEGMFVPSSLIFRWFLKN